MAGRNYPRMTSRSLKALLRTLTKEYARQIAGLRRCGESPAQVEVLAAFLPRIAEVRAALVRTLQDGSDPRPVRDILHRLAGEVLSNLEALPEDHRVARENLLRTLGLLNRADAQMAMCLEETRAGARSIVLPSAIAYQFCHLLFPPERLLVVAGRRQGKSTILEATFDVTGSNSGGHVRADPTRLGRALIAMDLSDTYLAAWVHSHPGTGPEATCPSATDLHQHQDWLQDYSPDLVGVIAVADGWIRFWGPALEHGQVRLQVIGSGIHPEDKDECLYRLVW